MLPGRGFMIQEIKRTDTESAGEAAVNGDRDLRMSTTIKSEHDSVSENML